MKAIWRKCKENKEGASLVSVIIGVVFLATIGIAILTVATKYAVSVYVDRGSTDNFYAAEGIMEEVKTGLKECAMTASKNAYMTTLENYNPTTPTAAPGGTVTARQKFTEQYINNLGKSLLTHFDWKMGDAAGVPIEDSNLCEKLKGFTTKPQFIEKADHMGVVINCNAKGDYYLTVKNIRVDYQESGYRSVIQTDISIAVPDYKLQGDSTLNEVKNYLSISDGIFEVSNMGSGTSELTGDIYSGRDDTDGAGVRIKANHDSDDQVKFACNSIISRGSLDLLTGAKVDLRGEGAAGDLWVRNIRLLQDTSKGTASEFTKLTMKENAYVANDLSIQDHYAEVSLGGKYYGYSYNKENSTADHSGDAPEYSSAILVNGFNTKLCADGSDGNEKLGKLLLAGRSYVSEEQSDGTLGAGTSGVMMGQSAAVKSDQLVYLVPDNCILLGTDGKEGHNPVVRSEWDEKLKANANDEDQTLKAIVDGTKLKEKFADKSGTTYLDAGSPCKANFNNKEGYVFFFLNFASDAKANEFFEDFYKNTDEWNERLDSDADTDEGNQLNIQEKMTERARTYLANSDMGLKLSANLSLVAGNIVTNYEKMGVTTGDAWKEGMQDASYFDGQEPAAKLLDDGKNTGRTYANKQLYLLPSGNASGMRLTTDEEKQKLVENTLIKFDKLQPVMDKTDSASGGRLYATNGDCTIGTGSSSLDIRKGLVIAKGDVTLEGTADFHGLVIAGGKVSVRPPAKMTADIVTVSALMEKVRTDPAWKDFREIFPGMNGEGTQNETDIDKCFRYENWTKKDFNE